MSLSVLQDFLFGFCGVICRPKFRPFFYKSRNKTVNFGWVLKANLLSMRGKVIFKLVLESF